MVTYQVVNAVEQAKKFLQDIGYSSKEEQLLAFDIVSRALQELQKENKQGGIKMEEKRIIEISGVKVEVDMSSAKRIDEFKIGDNVKVLKKDYNGFSVYPGVIIEFVNFKALPTIIIAMFKQDYSGSRLEFLNYNSKTEDVEICGCSEHELRLEKNKTIDLMNQEIHKHEMEAETLRAKRDYFEKHFSKYFEKE